MKKKYLRFAMNGGEAWDLPKEVVAKNRAKYYAEIDKDTTYEEEFEFTMSDDYEAIDWLQNNMNADEFEQHLVKVSDPKPTSFLERWKETDHSTLDEIER